MISLIDIAHTETWQLVQNEMATRLKVEIILLVTNDFQLVIYFKSLMINSSLIYILLSIAFLQHYTTCV